MTSAPPADPVELTPPSDPEAEKAALGAMLQDADARIAILAVLRSSDFAVPEHSQLFSALAEFAHAMEPDETLDIITFRNALEATGDLEAIGGQAFLVDLCDACPAPSAGPAYARIIRKKSAARTALNAGLELARRASEPGADAVAILAETREILREIATRAKPVAPKSLRALVAENPELRPPVVHGLLRAGETMNIIAPTKTGKSWLSAALALDVAMGGRFLDLYDCERGDVLILDNELHGETVANRIPRVAAALDIPLADVQDRVFVENLRGRLMDLYALRDYLAAVQPGRYKMIVLDAFYRFLPRDTDENSNADLANLDNIVDSMADRLGACFVLIHHSSKGSQSGKTVTDVGSGAGAQSRACDTHLVLRAHEMDGCYVLDAAARSWPPITPIALRWEFPIFRPDESLDPAALKPDRPRRPRPPKEPAEPVKAWTVEGFVADFVRPDPAPRAAILEAARTAGLSENRAKNLLLAAEAGGRVFRWTFGRSRQVQFSTIQQPALEGTSDACA